jgi:hypothetical protein
LIHSRGAYLPSMRNGDCLDTQCLFSKTPIKANTIFAFAIKGRYRAFAAATARCTKNNAVYISLDGTALSRENLCRSAHYRQELVRRLRQRHSHERSQQTPHLQDTNTAVNGSQAHGSNWPSPGLKNQGTDCFAEWNYYVDRPDCIFLI